MTGQGTASQPLVEDKLDPVLAIDHPHGNLPDKYDNVYTGWLFFPLSYNDLQKVLKRIALSERAI